jgi:hypothetical protein
MAVSYDCKSFMKFGPVVTGHNVARPHLVFEAKDFARHGQDTARRRWGHSVDHNWSHFVFFEILK